MSEYQKIPGPFKRDPKTKQIVLQDWSTPELALLHAFNDWDFTEKVDGTNVRVYWDGYRVTYKGRTDRAEFSVNQDAALNKAFAGAENEVLFEQQFGNQGDVILYGELYGPGVQSGGKYRDDLSFILFDVRVGDWWLQRDAVEEIATNLGVDVAPLILTSVSLDMAIENVMLGMHSDVALNSKPFIYAEGLVGRLASGLRDRAGNRIIVKVKHDDLYGL